MIPSEKSLYEYLSSYAIEYPDKKMLGGVGGWLTVAEVHAIAKSIAFRLAAVGFKRDMLVALRARRCVGTALTILGLRFLGAVVVLTAPQNSCAEFIAEGQTAIPIAHTLEVKRDGLWVDGGQRLELLEPEETEDFKPVRQPKDAGFIIFTSGSTGKIKAVMLSEYNLVNNLVDSMPLGGYSEEDIALGALPLDHVFGLVLLCGTIVLRHAVYFPQKVDVPNMLAAVEQERITRMNGVPSLYLAMAEQKDIRNLKSLRVGFIGGGPCTPEQFRRIEESLEITLVPVYGMSEFIGISCASYRDPQESRATSIGPFYAMNTGRILREDGSEADVGEEGEICADGPSRMVGYYGDTSPRSDFLHTGDLGFVDVEGVLHISGRKKDIIIRNGINLSIKRIEDAILSIPTVKAACVVGLPHERLGEAPYAMVVSDDSQIELRERLEQILRKNEIPLGILCTAHLPMTRTGKVDKLCIQKQLATWISTAHTDSIL